VTVFAAFSHDLKSDAGRHPPAYPSVVRLP
jgi:hypothetical protein